jgi:hypothetical protein
VLTRNAIRSADIELNFDYRHMIVAYTSLSGPRLPAAVVAQKLDTVMTRLRQLPGAEAVTAAVMPPLGQRYSLNTLPGLPPVYTNYVAPNYFDAMRLPLVRGRVFRPGEVHAAIVSETAARAIWPNLVVDGQSVEAYIPIEPSRVDESAIIVHVKGDPSQFIRAVPAKRLVGPAGNRRVDGRAARRRSGYTAQSDTVLASLGLLRGCATHARDRDSDGDSARVPATFCGHCSIRPTRPLPSG